nr:immunoglobulin light chain junction region [Macaca mulatta]
CQHYDSTPYIF